MSLTSDDAKFLENVADIIVTTTKGALTPFHERLKELESRERETLAKLSKLEGAVEAMLTVAAKHKTEEL